jgi:GNAT superfamily N-acetyltransferase
MIVREERDGFVVSTDPTLLQIDFIHEALGRTYWAANRTRAVTEESIRNSICFGIYETKTQSQVGFARIVTDRATFSWVCDVVIDENCRRHGLGKWLMACVVSHPSVQGTVSMLGTRDAHGLYEKFGYARWEAMKRSNLEPPFDRQSLLGD